MSAADRLPDTIIIGAMKCATSTLHEQLAAQPGIFATEPKEPNFFSDEDIYARGLGWYHGLFDGAAEGDLCIESSTHYTKLPTHPRAVERIAEHRPDARFVYVMRHPIDRLISHHIHDWSEGLIEGPIDQTVATHAPLVDYGLYAMQLRPYLETFGPDRVLPVFFERLVGDSQAELERVCRFMGYHGEPRWQTDKRSENVSDQRMRRSALRDAIVYAPGVSQIRRWLVPRGVREWVKGLWRMRNRPQLSDNVRAELEARFDEDLAVLGGWLGTTLSCASFKERVTGGGLEWQVERIHAEPGGGAGRPRAIGA